MIIDVSEHNGTLNWAVLKTQIEAAIIRCGYGRDSAAQDDKQWTRNVSECEKNGIPYGVYLYSYADNADDANSEAQHIRRCLKGHHPQLPVFYDLEEAKMNRCHSARSNYYAWESGMQGSGYQIGLYTGEYYYNTYMQGTAANWLWIARYGQDDGRVPAKKPVLQDGKRIHLWQYTSKGMTGHMDCSLVLDPSIMAAGSAAPAGQKVESMTTYTVGSYTLHDIKYAPRTYDECVKFLQQLLNAKVGAGLVEDGYCGAKTLAAIAQYQSMVLRSTTCGKATWQNLLK